MSRSTGIIIVLTMLLIVSISLTTWGGVNVYSVWVSSRRLDSRISITSAYPHLKSGDILLFISYGVAISLFTGNQYGHAGIVVEIDGELYISETTTSDANNPGLNSSVNYMHSPSQDGVRLSHLIPRLAHYAGSVHLMSLKNPLTTNQEITLKKHVREFCEYPSRARIVFHILLSKIGVNISCQYHCFSHVAHILDEIGFTPVSIASKNKTLCGSGVIGVVNTVSTMWKETLAIDNAYMEPVELICDLGMATTIN